MLAVLVHWWTGSRQTQALLDAADGMALSPPRRALVHAIRLLEQARPLEAAALARDAERRHPGTAEIAYALGETLWHAADRAGGVAWLATAIQRDPAWEMALPHALEWWAARGDAAAIRAAADRVDAGDRSGAAVLRVAAAIAERAYPAAVSIARAATAASRSDDPRLWQARAEAEILAGELDAAERSIEVARASWPVDDRGNGPFAIWAELLLYRDREAAFARAASGVGPADVLRRIAWHGEAPSTPRPIRTDRGLRPQGDSGMAPPPLAELVTTLGAALRGEDATEFYQLSPYPEVRELGAGLAAARAGDREAAIAAFTRGRAAAIGETRMLLAYWLARTLHAGGAATTEACEDVRRPRRYASYRAVLLRDCIAWEAR